jgi:glucosamine 6-phosphate synthetase-like amidotransferase/phosphosugar isomerase protein
MCDIAGYIGKKRLSQNVLKNTLKSMHSRGPDNSGYTYL